jgi:hypothetical protein
VELSEDGSKSLADSEEWFAWAQWTIKFYEDTAGTVARRIPEAGRIAICGGQAGMHHNQRLHEPSR